MKNHIEDNIQIPIENIALDGELHIPLKAKGIVLFAHGSGSSRFSPRNQFVAKYLRSQQLGTLFIDLLTPEEGKKDDITRELRFNIDLLADRLQGITRWLVQDARTRSSKIGYFGSSTGAAAALIAAAKLPGAVSAVVSRGGRPDLAKESLPLVQAPSLFIVGGADYGVIELNQEAFEKLQCIKQFQIVPHATHLFEEAGALEKVAEIAGLWFLKYLQS